MNNKRTNILPFMLLFSAAALSILYITVFRKKMIYYAINTDF
jgi:hypothetical protein